MADTAVLPASKRTWRQGIRRACRMFLTVYLLVLLGLMLLENKFIFIPTNFYYDDWSPAGIKSEDAHFSAADGTKLHGWYAPHDNPAAVILFCHGNAGNITHRIDIIRALHDRAGRGGAGFRLPWLRPQRGQPRRAGRAGRRPRRPCLAGTEVGRAAGTDRADGRVAWRRGSRRPGRRRWRGR